MRPSSIFIIFRIPIRASCFLFPLICIRGQKTERPGFEPGIGFKAYASLAVRYFRPLSHLSITAFKSLKDYIKTRAFFKTSIFFTKSKFPGSKYCFRKNTIRKFRNTFDSIYKNNWSFYVRKPRFDYFVFKFDLKSISQGLD